MDRPSHLPNFAEPPLLEVVTGFQFETIKGYSSVYDAEIRKLFLDEFSFVEEHPILEPSFETFGGSGQNKGPQFNFGPPPTGSRLWFTSKESDHLVQFQRDRLILNWRRCNDKPYPRYESIAKQYKNYIELVDQYFKSEFDKNLSVNQVEVSHINIIPVTDFSDVDQWLTIFSQQLGSPENLHFGYTEVMKDDDGQPYARFVFELKTAFSNTPSAQDKAFQLTLSYKGAPSSPSIADALKFAYEGREKIVTTFDSLTTTKAHNIWGKK